MLTCVYKQTHNTLKGVNMKAKRFPQTLKLNKKTVANLSAFDQDKVRGGLFPFIGSRHGCEYTLDSLCVVSYCCMTDPYAYTEKSCELPRCAK